VHHPILGILHGEFPVAFFACLVSLRSRFPSGEGDTGSVRRPAKGTDALLHVRQRPGLAARHTDEVYLRGILPLGEKREELVLGGPLR
jgi:hypothetical protein